MERKLPNWIEAYYEFTRGTESPDSFHLWSALVTLAAAAQRKIYLEMGHLEVHTNMFVVLVGPSGGPRKSTALNEAKKLLRQAEEYGTKFNIAPKKASAAAIVSKMARIGVENKAHQSLTAYASELGTLLGAGNTEVSDVLTDLWDCDPFFDKETVGRGAEMITAPWLNIGACVTPVWLADNLPRTATEGGFVSRGLFVYEETKARRVAVPRRTQEQRDLGKWLVHDLAYIASLEGTFSFTPAGEKFFTDWYENEANFIPRLGQSLETYYDRKHIHVLKAAMCFALAESDDLLLTDRYVEQAIAAVQDVEASMALAFQGVGRNILSMDQERIKREILMAGEAGRSYKDLIRAHIHRIDKTQLDLILSTLHQSQEIGSVGEPGAGQLFFDRKIADRKRAEGE